MLVAPFMTRRLTKEFIEKNGRSPTKDEFIAIQHEAVNTLINNNSVYGILGQGGTKMSENASKRIPTVGQVIDHTKDPVVIKPTEEQVVFLSRDIKAIYTPTLFGECEHPDSKNIVEKLSGKNSNPVTMTKEMYENFVKQGKKFVTLTSQAFDSLEETDIDLDGDTVIVDGQKYFVNMESWYLGRK